MGVLADLVDYLVTEPKAVRKQFFANPEQFIANYEASQGVTLSPDDKAALFAMQRPLLIDYVMAYEHEDVANPVLNYRFQDDQLGEPDIWNAGDTTYPEVTPTPLVSFAMAAGGGAGGGWTEPNPKIHRFKPTSGAAGSTVPFRLVGSGILSLGQLIFVKLGPDPARMAFSLPTHTSADFDVRNFRNIAVSLSLAIPSGQQTGDYKLYVRNSPWTPAIAKKSNPSFKVT